MTILAGVVAMILFDPRGAGAQKDGACSTGSGVRIEARAHGVEIIFRVTNRRRDAITRLQMGTSAAYVLTDQEMPRLGAMPSGWRGRVLRDEASGHGRVVWEAVDESQALASGSRSTFSIHVRASLVVRNPREKDAAGNFLPFLDFTSLPFTARMVSGACWSGRTLNPDAPPEGGRHAFMHAAAVRAITNHPRTPILIDVPMRESLMRISRQHHVFLTVPLALTFGVSGGFSADMSIGIGLTWKPTPHISASARRTFGTFLFNNRTHVRAAGIDVTIPIARTFLYEGVSRESRQLVIGVEWFQRDVVKWAGFFEGPQWYASGTGIAIRVGIRTIGWSWT
jgi:hypothetical protein